LTIKVVNKKRKGKGVYIGRPSPLGNPYTHLKWVASRPGMFLVNNREEAIAKYEVWIKDVLAKDSPQKEAYTQLQEQLEKEGELSLVCWCAPLACHGDVLKKLLEGE